MTFIFQFKNIFKIFPFPRAILGNIIANRKKPFTAITKSITKISPSIIMKNDARKCKNLKISKKKNKRRSSSSHHHHYNCIAITATKSIVLSNQNRNPLQQFPSR